MYKMLIELLQKPALYEKTSAKFWNDEHISKAMLEAHLDPTTDAASRKPVFIEQSVEWISGLLPLGSRILDIGCGPGLYTKRFAKRGFCVTGLDFSQRSLAYATEHDPACKYVMQDYLTMRYDNEFDLITLIWCDYGALVPEDRCELLGRVYKALKSGGMFLLDVFTPQWNTGRTENTSWEVCSNGGFWSPNPHICLNAQYYYGERIDVARYVIVEAGNILSYNIWNTCFTKQSLAEELQQHHFIPVDFYSDVEGKPYEENSPTLCAVMKKQQGLEVCPS